MSNVHAGFNSGNSTIANLGDTTDFDVAAIWQLENFGFGNAARRRMQDSRHREAHLATEQARDTVAAQVAEAYSRVQSRKQQIAAVATEVEAADRALRLKFDGIRGEVLRPIEAQQAIDAFVNARLEQLDTVVSYNAAQLELLRAVGLPPQAAAQ